MIAWKPLGLSLLLTGCLTSGGKEARKQIRLDETELVGQYTLVDYLFEYGDGNVQNPAVLKLEGSLTLSVDSAYLERILVGATPPAYETKGKITQVWAIGAGTGKGEVEMTLEGDSTQSGTSLFSFRGDTLQLITSVSKARDASKIGYKETAYWLRDPMPK